MQRLDCVELKTELAEDSIINELNQSYQQSTNYLQGQSQQYLDTISALKLEI